MLKAFQGLQLMTGRSTQGEKPPSPQRGNNQDCGSGLREPLQDDKFVYVVCEQTTHNPQPTTHNIQQKTKNKKQKTENKQLANDSS